MRRCSPSRRPDSRQAQIVAVDDEAPLVEVQLAVARVAREPLLSSLRKPRPLTARSSGLAVTVRFPCVNSCCTCATFVPMPMLLAPAPASELANTSAKTAREALNPTVFEFATLLPITSRFFADALRPLRPD